MKERTEFRRCLPDSWGRKIICAVLLMAVALSASAQQDNSRRVRSTASLTGTHKAPAGLGEENASRVAASAQQIKAVLAKAPGLLVELKRWVSDEATSNGQMVD